jgi:hypothetical protein
VLAISSPIELGFLKGGATAANMVCLVILLSVGYKKLGAGLVPEQRKS